MTSTFLFPFPYPYPKIIFVDNILNHHKNTFLMLPDLGKIDPMFGIVYTPFKILSIWTFALCNMLFTFCLSFERMSLIKWTINFHYYDNE